MFIKKVKEFDEFSGEADVLVTDGEYEIMCYYFPANNAVQGAIVKEVTSLFTGDIMRTDKQKYLIDKEKEHFSYHLQGKVLDTQKPQIGIGKLIIELDKPLPKDIKLNEFVEFKVDRLDCWVDG